MQNNTPVPKKPVRKTSKGSESSEVKAAEQVTSKEAEIKKPMAIGGMKKSASRSGISSEATDQKKPPSLPKADNKPVSSKRHLMTSSSSNGNIVSLTKKPAPKPAAKKEEDKPKPTEPVEKVIEPIKSVPNEEPVMNHEELSNIPVRETLELNNNEAKETPLTSKPETETKLEEESNYSSNSVSNVPATVTAVSNASSKTTTVIEEEYKRKLEEKRREAREKAAKEAELERQRQEQIRLEEERKQREEEELERLAEEEELRLNKLAREQEEERLRLAIEQNEKLEAERRLKEENERKAVSASYSSCGQKFIHVK